ncbi:MAG: CYTH domain-containing protein [Lachnospiraceae bacterium]
MEIERKFLIKSLPDNLESYSFHQMEQGYLCTEPVVRIRRQDETYYLTYKSKGLMMREEYNLPLTKEAYLHLLPKIDGLLIVKKRYLIPLSSGLTVELDIFEGELAPLILAEVEFQTEEEANAFIPLEWFEQEVTHSVKYHNSFLSQKGKREVVTM